MKSVQGGVTTYYINDLVEYSGGVFTKFYYADGQRIAQRVGSAAPTYTLTDHLGSTRYTLNSSGAKTAEMRYYPWGSTHYSSNPAGTPRRQYTGQINDGDTGLYYYNARYYEPGLARFVQADTIVPDPANPQSFNRYAYALNSPVVHNDPSGHCVDGLTTIGCIIVGGLIVAFVVDVGITAHDMWQYQATINNPNATAEEKEQAMTMQAVALGFEMAEPDFGVSLPIDDMARHGIVFLGNAAEAGARRVTRTQALADLFAEAMREDILIDSSADAVRFLEMRGAEAATLGPDLILIKPEHIGNLRILREELIHVYQQRAGLHTGQMDSAEIEARALMILNADKWGLTPEDLAILQTEIDTIIANGGY